MEQHSVPVNLSAVFLECDEKGKGFLSREDLKVAMVRLFGYKPCKFEVDELMGNARLGLSKEAFISEMRKKMAAVDKDEEIREIFRAFDRQSKGFITIEDLHHVTSTVSPHFPKHRLIAAFQANMLCQKCLFSKTVYTLEINSTARELDGDKDGRISFRDFEFLMKYRGEDDL